jgi:thiol-disulfide isomerase/thioredoxin
MALALAAGLALAAAGCGGARTKSTDAPAQVTPPEVRRVTIEQLHQVVAEPGARLVLLNVWATWCVPCREEFPDLVRIGRDYRDRGLRLVLVSGDFESETTAVDRFLAAQGVDFLTYLKQGADMPFIDGIDSRWSGALPVTVLYDGAGRKRWFHEGKTSYDTLRTRIEEALAAPSAPAH